jgi:hypothetical protein
MLRLLQMLQLARLLREFEVGGRGAAASPALPQPESRLHPDARACATPALPVAHTLLWAAPTLLQTSQRLKKLADAAPNGMSADDLVMARYTFIDSRVGQKLSGS